MTAYKNGPPKGVPVRDHVYTVLGQLLRSVTSTNVKAAWRPNPGAQTIAYESDADVTGYGGRAGGGKTSFLIGTAIRDHAQAIVFRRTFEEFGEIHLQAEEILGPLGKWVGKTRSWLVGLSKRLRYGACNRDSAKYTYQGQPHDYYGFDEVTNWAEGTVVYLMGWNRTKRQGQRCRVCLTFNPPSNAEGQWVVDWFAPWLDKDHPHPALPGELRWFVRVRGRDLEVRPRLYWDVNGHRVFDGDDHGYEVVRAHGKLPRLVVDTPNGPRELKALPEELTIEGEPYWPSSRTFVPAGMDDNPFIGPEYRAKIDAMPEPLRSQLKYGDFAAGRQDDPWQVIPSAWIDAAVARWKRRTVDLGVGGVRRPAECTTLHQVGVDVARDGDDEAVVAKRYGKWYAHPIYVEKDKNAPKGQRRTGPMVADQVLLNIEPGQNPLLLIDLINVGTSVVDSLREKTDPQLVVDFVASANSAKHRTFQGGLTVRNDRTLAYWHMRELLDPENGHDIMLPPSSKLRADLCAPRFAVKNGCIELEKKEDIQERLGRSTDTGDAFCLAALDDLVTQLRF